MANLTPTTRLVMLAGKAVGQIERLLDGQVRATLHRPKAESDKNLGLFPSLRAAERAVRDASVH